MTSSYRNVALVVLAAALVAGLAWGAAAQEGQAAQSPESPVGLSVALQEVRAVTLADGKAGLDVMVRVTLTGWGEAAFPELSGRLVAFTPVGERSFTPVEVALVETRSPSEAVVRLRFVRPASAPYMVAFVGLPASERAGRPETWTGVVFTEADIRS